MWRSAVCIVLSLCAGSLVLGFDEPPGLLDRFLQRMRLELGRLPDYVCTQTVERFSRSSAERPWEKVDTLNFEVALVGNQELYARPGARAFQNRSLAEMVGRGTTSTGQLGLMAKHVFLTSAARFTYHGAGERNGRRTHEYQYDVAPERSSYRLRTGRAESTVGFQGAFWIDSSTLDLVRLEIQAYDIPERLGLAEADTSLDYARMPIDADQVLLPVVATLSVAAVDGAEDLNRMRLTGCRHYRADSAIQFPEATGRAEQPSQVQTAAPLETLLPAGMLLDLTLDSNLDPATSKVGDAVKAKVAKPLGSGERELIPQGAIVLGRVVRMDKQTMPFPVYDIALEFDTLAIGDLKVPLAATMVDAGPAAGLLRQAKRLDPRFTRRRTGRMDVLVHEVQSGQGILLWDARRGSLPRGLRMKWRVQGERWRSENSADLMPAESVR